MLGLARSSYYYQPRPESAETLALLRRLDELYMELPFFGSRRMAAMLSVNRKRMQRLMRIAGIEALYPKPRLSRPGPGHEIHPYLLRDLVIDRPNQVWSSDITYVPMRRGFLYLVAVMDWFSRYVLSWELSTTMDTGFCLAALEAALGQGAPEIFNTDQGSQFTSADFTGVLRQRQILISMDGRGRWMDNVFIERLWRSVKYELIYPGDFATGGNCGWRWKTISGFTITAGRIRRWATGRLPRCSLRATRNMQLLELGAPPQTPGFIAFGQTGCFAVGEAFGLPYNQGASQEDRATQGCDPSASRGPD